MEKVGIDFFNLTSINAFPNFTRSLERLLQALKDRRTALEDIQSKDDEIMALLRKLRDAIATVTFIQDSIRAYEEYKDKQDRDEFFVFILRWRSLSSSRVSIHASIRFPVMIGKEIHYTEGEVDFDDGEHVAVFKRFGMAALRVSCAFNSQSEEHASEEEQVLQLQRTMYSKLLMHLVSNSRRSGDAFCLKYVDFTEPLADLVIDSLSPPTSATGARHLALADNDNGIANDTENLASASPALEAPAEAKESDVEMDDDPFALSDNDIDIAEEPPQPTSNLVSSAELEAGDAVSRVGAGGAAAYVDAVNDANAAPFDVPASLHREVLQQLLDLRILCECTADTAQRIPDTTILGPTLQRFASYTEDPVASILDSGPTQEMQAKVTTYIASLDRIEKFLGVIKNHQKAVSHAAKSLDQAYKILQGVESINEMRVEDFMVWIDAHWMDGSVLCDVWCIATEIAAVTSPLDGDAKAIVIAINGKIGACLQSATAAIMSFWWLLVSSADSDNATFAHKSVICKKVVGQFMEAIVHIASTTVSSTASPVSLAKYIVEAKNLSTFSVWCDQVMEAAIVTHP